MNGGYLIDETAQQREKGTKTETDLKKEQERRQAEGELGRYENDSPHSLLHKQPPPPLS